MPYELVGEIRQIKTIARSNHKAALALHFIHQDFARTHKTLRETPAMEAGVTDRVWSQEDIARLA